MKTKHSHLLTILRALLRIQPERFRVRLDRLSNILAKYLQESGYILPEVRYPEDSIKDESQRYGMTVVSYAMQVVDSSFLERVGS